jgi:bifunctional DNase/RNase
MNEMQPVEVLGLYLDPTSGSAIVLLGEAAAAEQVLPVFIGTAEAQAIAIGIEQLQLARPGTHDLAIAALHAAGARVVGARVVALEGGTFIGSLDVETAGGVESVDARPSDAIALAVRVGAPVYVDRRMFEEVAVRILRGSDAPFDEAEVEEIVGKFREFLDSAEPSQFEEPPPV